jgi:erythromycin esterase-like protein
MGSDLPLHDPVWLSAAIATTGRIFEITCPGSDGEKARIAQWAHDVHALATLDLTAAVNAAKHGATSGQWCTAPRQQAVAVILVYLDQLFTQDRDEAIAAAFTAANQAAPHSELETRAVASWARLIDALALKKIKSAVSAVRYAAVYSKAHSLLKKRSVASILQHLDGLKAVDLQMAFNAAKTAYGISIDDSNCVEHRFCARQKLDELHAAVPRLRAPPQHF